MRGAFLSWWDRTHGCRFELLRHFFMRLFDSDLIRSRGYLAVSIVSILITLFMAGVFLTQSLTRKYTELVYHSTPQVNRLVLQADRLFFIAISMVLAGFLAALLWHSLFPERKDYLILGALPVRAVDIFAGKFAALILFVAIFAAAWCVPSSVFLPIAQRNHWSVPPLGPWHMASHFAASVLGVWMVFFGLMAIQGLAMALLPDGLFRRASLFLQVLLIAALLSALPLLTWIPSLYKQMETRPAWALLAPPIWVLGFEEWLIGNREPFVRTLAQRAAIAAAVVFAVSLLAYLATYRRHTRNAAESVPHLGRRGALARAAEAVTTFWIRDPRELAACSFLWKTLIRSRWHKVLLGVFAGIGCAFVLDTFVELMIQKSFHGFATHSPQMVRAALSLPLVFIFFLLLGLRYIYSIPAEPDANWIFRIHEEPDTRPRLLASAERAYVWLGIVPVLVVTFPVEVLLLDAVSAALHMFVCLLLGLSLVEWLLWRQDKVPFTCSWLPGQGNLAMKVVLTWIGFSAFAYTVTPAMETWAFSDPATLLILFGLLLATFAKLRQHRLKSVGEEPLVFDAEPEPAVRELGLAT